MAEVSFDDIIKEGRRKKQAEKLAQEIFGKGRRSSAPPSGPKAGLGGSLASRVGVNKTKRNSSLPRSNSPRQNNPRSNRPSGPSRPSTTDNFRARPSYTQPIVDRSNDSRSNSLKADDAANVGGGLNIKGAAGGPYIVIAQNFMPGTTAADIESVMADVGGQIQSCRLVTSNPTVIAEMVFTDKVGAERVIETFNGKKADGRVLYVYWKAGGGGLRRDNSERPPVPEQAQALGGAQGDDVAMEVDENAEAREAEDRRREERRGRDDRAPRGDVFPSGPRGQGYYRSDSDSYYDRRPRQNYQDGRYGFGGGYRDGGRGRYGNDRRYGGGQSWRP